MYDSPKNSIKMNVFVHVPKTAGTTINETLAKVAPGRSHFEEFVGKSPDEIQTNMQNLKWISGHLNIEWFEEHCFKNSSFFPVYYSCMREPLKQVRSHFNWLIEIYYRGQEFYNDHPPVIKVISEDIRNSNRSSPSEICSLLKKYEGLFLNFQSRYLLSESHFDLPFDIEFLRDYEFIATEETIPDLLSILGADTSTVKRENASGYHFDPELFNSDQVREFLQIENSKDDTLYKAVLELFGLRAAPDTLSGKIKNLGLLNVAKKPLARFKTM